MYLHPDGGRYCYASVKAICNKAAETKDITYNTVSSALKTLVDNDLLKVYNTGKYLDARGETSEVKNFPDFYFLADGVVDQYKCDQIAISVLKDKGIDIQRFIKDKPKPQQNPVNYTDDFTEQWDQGYDPELLSLFS